MVLNAGPGGDTRCTRRRGRLRYSASTPQGQPFAAEEDGEGQQTHKNPCGKRCAGKEGSGGQ